jgi:periodic tryptophan protein 1
MGGVSHAVGDDEVLSLICCGSVEEEDGTSASGSGSGDDENENEDEDDEGDVKMDEKVTKSNDPNDLSAFKMDEYDQEESKGVGE